MLTLNITGIPGLTVDAFMDFSKHPGNGNAFTSIAHVQNTGSNNEGSAIIGAMGPSIMEPIPEPANALVGMLLGAGVMARRARRKRNLQPE